MPGRILIIDPEPEAALYLQAIFQKRGHAVEIARDGVAGLVKLISFEPDLVITEISLKALNGFELAAKISGGEGPHPPLIFYTGMYRDEKTRREIIARYGALHYFVKPYQSDLLTKAVLEVLGKLGKWDGPSVVTDSAMYSEPAAAPAPPLDSETEVDGEPEAADREPDDSGTGSAGVQPRPSVPNTPSPDRSRAPDAAAGHRQSAPREPTLTQRSARAALKEIDNFTRERLESVSRQASKAAPAVPPSSSALPAGNFRPPAVFQPSRKRSTLRLVLLLVTCSLFGVTYYFRSQLPFLQRLTVALTGEIRETSQTAPPAERELPLALEKTQLRPLSNEPTAQAADAATEAAPIQPPAGESDVAGEENPSQGGDPVAANPEEADGNKASKDEAQTAGPSSAGDSSPTVQFNDVTGRRSTTYLVRSKEPVLTPSVIAATGERVLVMRIVVNRQGRVVEVVPVNSRPQMSALSRVVLNAVYDWQFSPLPNAYGTATKYFSFRIAPGKPPG